MINSKEIKNYIVELCNILNIDVPTISYCCSHFPTKTMLAQCNSDGTTIYINKSIKNNFDIFLAIAHELRHIYQIQTNYNLFFDTYKPRECFEDVNEYNLQFAEIDANAFACIVMIDFFHRKPLFKGYSDRVKNEIDFRIPYVIEELSQD